jgi:hypothetical protein
VPRRTRQSRLEALGWQFTDNGEGAIPGALASLAATVRFQGDSLPDVLDAVTEWENGQTARKPEARHPLVQGR